MVSARSAVESTPVNLRTLRSSLTKSEPAEKMDDGEPKKITKKAAARNRFVMSVPLFLEK
jgi:hypothetical protein